MEVMERKETVVSADSVLVGKATHKKEPGMEP